MRPSISCYSTIDCTVQYCTAPTLGVAYHLHFCWLPQFACFFLVQYCSWILRNCASGSLDPLQCLLALLWCTVLSCTVQYRYCTFLLTLCSIHLSSLNFQCYCPASAAMFSPQLNALLHCTVWCLTLYGARFLFLYYYSTNILVTTLLRTVSQSFSSSLSLPARCVFVQPVRSGLSYRKFSSILYKMYCTVLSSNRFPSYINASVSL